MVSSTDRIHYRIDLAHLHPSRGRSSRIGIHEENRNITMKEPLKSLFKPKVCFSPANKSAADKFHLYFEKTSDFFLAQEQAVCWTDTDGRPDSRWLRDGSGNFFEFHCIVSKAPPQGLQDSSATLESYICFDDIVIGSPFKYFLGRLKHVFVSIMHAITFWLH